VVTAVLVGVAVALAALLVRPPRPRARVPRAAPQREAARAATGRGAVLWPLLAGLGTWTVVGGPTGGVAALAVAGAVRVVLARAEPPDVRREREAVRRDLPALVLLVSLALRAGAATGPAVRVAARALPGPGADRLLPAADRLGLGVDPERVWSELAGDAELAPLGRALARAERSGAPVATVVGRLADDLADTGRTDVEQQARAVGVRAAVPLGLCLLPAFLLLGIVPLVASLVADLSW
jgi:Flp pilus assembly protein TadB